MSQNYLSASSTPKEMDVFGEAALDFYNLNKKSSIQVDAIHFDSDFIPVEYLFRSFEEMPKLEQMALKRSSGRVLDVGAGVGSHSIYLQELGLEVKAIDQSEGCIQVAKKRGLVDAQTADFFTYKDSIKFDTLLFMMNGIGIAGKIENLPLFFKQAKNLLKPNGKLILDSSDLIFLFDDLDNETQKSYYGEMTYQISYKNLVSKHFDWLFIDFLKLKEEAFQNGFSCNCIANGNHYDYLAELKLI